MPHDHSHSHARHPEHAQEPLAAHDHNHADADHVHSHMHRHDEAAEVQVLTDQFIDGFVAARDKMACLRIAGVPFEIPDGAGGPSLKLVDVQLKTQWQVGTASPSFGSSELSYLPYPGEMVTERTNMDFIYVSLRSGNAVDLRRFIAGKTQAG